LQQNIDLMRKSYKAGMVMAFGMVDRVQEFHMGTARKKEMEIACKCWFTADGKMQPLMFKYQDGQGEIHTISEIMVHSREDRDLLASPQTRFRVTVNCQGIGVEAELVYYKKECKWVMVVGKN